MTIQPAISLQRLRWNRSSGADQGVRVTAEETPVAIVHDGSTTAVMMATPADLEDFAVGFSLSEGIAERLEDIRDIDVVHGALGVEVRLWLAAGCSERVAARRRHMAGPTGCGLCGVDSLAAAVRPLAPIHDDAFSLEVDELMIAMDALSGAQPLGRATRAMHAAGLWRAGALTVREDVGRHNALDKLIGARARGAASDANLLLLTSRVSVEMVQKAVVLGAPVLCAVSAPTALAVRTADAAGLTLVGVARSDGVEVFTHHRRVRLPAAGG